MLRKNGRAFDLIDSGYGPPLLFVPGSFSTPAAWRGVQEHIRGKYRLLTTSLCGYGKTSESRSVKDNLIHHEIEILETIAQEINEPLHLIGHSFGGTVCLAAVLEDAFPIASVTTFEANPVNLVKNSFKPELFLQVKQASRLFQAEYSAGNNDAAEFIIDFWGGSGSFTALPEEVREYCRKTAGANILDWLTAYSFLAIQRDYEKIGVPALIVRGEMANSAMIEITEILCKSIKHSKSAIVEGSNHFLINTHPDKCAKLINWFLSILHNKAR
ncbi:MAG: hypothetical protein CMM58_06640 [Rhodospirillaceae bacterium]|nr:hypothetical protein [Rhodospirillaceae bacterium]|tara:strand:- start:1172 stop:1987 length:816 start_codon:yes stop_codon:yes gene_type:complete